MRPTVLTTLVLSWVVAGTVFAGVYQDRFVWVFGWGLRSDRELGEVVQLLETAASSGMNGAVLSANLDSLCKQSPDYFRRLNAVKDAAERLGLDLIPSVFSVGYGGGALAHNRNLAEGMAVTDAPFLVKGGSARLVPDQSVRLVNGGFEEFKGDRLAGFGFHDSPGLISLVDTQVVHSGNASLRLENFKSDQYGHGRVMQRVRVLPHRCYRVSLWVKTQELEPASAFRVTILAQDRELSPRTFELPASTDWRKLTFLFNSLENNSVNLYAGVWEGRGGKLWLDDWTVEEVGPINALRRPGTPFLVRSDDGGVRYLEGKDFAPFQDPQFNFNRVDRDAPAVTVLPEGRIRDGQRLKVSWYHPMVINDSQVTVCMAEPELYHIFEHEAELLAEHLRPRRVLLNMDEIRMGGTCESCRDKGMAQLLGECITRQTEILRRRLPGAQIYVWSDMLDPSHNARGQYYLVNGDYTGSWDHVPKDLIVTVWGGAPREKSLRFFSSLGFETLVACYYDANDLAEVKSWLDLARKTPQVRGFMYTPWLKKYELLPQFGQLLQQETQPNVPTK